MTPSASPTGAAGSVSVMTSIKRRRLAKQAVCVEKCYAEPCPGSVISFPHAGSETPDSPGTGRQRAEAPGWPEKCFFTFQKGAVTINDKG